MDGDSFWGENQILFNENSWTLEGLTWENAGFHIERILDAGAHRTLHQTVEKRLAAIVANVTGECLDNFQLEHYHRHVDSTEHQQIIAQTRALGVDDIQLDMEALRTQISALMEKPMALTNEKLEREIVILRINRPNHLDLNPPHRDAYLDIWKRTLNLWIPIAGCDARTSLPLMPGSHLWPESDVLRTVAGGATINGLSYQVPAIIQTRLPLAMVRPNPRIGEALLFTPYLIHGAAMNESSDTTRISLEIRIPFEQRFTTSPDEHVKSGAIY